MPRRPDLLAAAGLLVLAAACASSSSASREGALRDPNANLPMPTRIDGVGDVRVTRNADAGVRDALPVSLDRAFAALPAVYEKLGLTVNVIDQGGRMLGAQNVRAPRQINRQNLSRYLDCGSGLNGPNADLYDVTLTVVSRVLPPSDSTSATTSEVVTQVAGSGVPRSTSGIRVTCTSTGRLEVVVNKGLALRAVTP